MSDNCHKCGRAELLEPTATPGVFVCSPCIPFATGDRPVVHGLPDNIHCITLWPEWAHAVAHLGKRIENRERPPWASLMGQRVALHAGAYIGGRKGKPATLEGLEAVVLAAIDAGQDGALFDSRNLLILGPDDKARPVVTSAIVCTAVLARCERNPSFPIAQSSPAVIVPQWGSSESRFWWHLADVEVLDVPVPCKGAQGFWEWTR